VVSETAHKTTLLQRLPSSRRHKSKYLMPASKQSSSSIIFTWLRKGRYNSRRHLRQVARPPSGSVFIFVRSPDLPPAPLLSSSGRLTFLRFQRRLPQVVRPSSGSVVALVGLLDLPPTRHHRQVARPSSGSVVIIIIRWIDLPVAPLSSSLGR
jgi:hypothetical protein